MVHAVAAGCYGGSHAPGHTEGLSINGQKSFMNTWALQAEKCLIGRKHPSRDVIFSGQNLARKCQKIISLHDVLEPLKQALWHHVM